MHIYLKVGRNRCRRDVISLVLVRVFKNINNPIKKTTCVTNVPLRKPLYDELQRKAIKVENTEASPMSKITILFDMFLLWFFRKKYLFYKINIDVLLDQEIL